MPHQSRQSIILDALKQKIQLAKDELGYYGEDYKHCQHMLQTELEQRSKVEAENVRLQRRNANVEDELKRSMHLVTVQQMALHEARASLNESRRLRKALEHRNQLQLEKIDLINWEMCQVKRHAKESDSTAQLCNKRVTQLTERLNQSEKQLEASRNSHALLQTELLAAAQNLHCVERAFERSAQQVRNSDRQVAKLQQRLFESEKRAQQAELNAQQMQLASAHLEECLEQRWCHKIHKCSVNSTN